MNERKKVWWFPDNAVEPIEVETLNGLLVGEVAGYISGTEVNYYYATEKNAWRCSYYFHRGSHVYLKDLLKEAEAELRRRDHNEALRGMEECDRMHARAGRGW